MKLTVRRVSNVLYPHPKWVVSLYSLRHWSSPFLFYVVSVSSLYRRCYSGIQFLPLSLGYKSIQVYGSVYTVTVETLSLETDGLRVLGQ